MVKRADIADHARRWLGVPYQHQGRTRYGIDCVGLLICVARDLGLSKFDIDGYSRNPSGMAMRRLLRQQLDEIVFSEIAVGDVFHMKLDSEPQHIAVVSRLNPYYIVHSSAIAGKVVEQRLDVTAYATIRGCYRVPLNG